MEEKTHKDKGYPVRWQFPHWASSALLDLPPKCER